jgi:capsular exopolysaccharide synthesis family protein
VELRDYLRVLARRWPTIVSLTLVGVAIAAAVTWTSPQKYESTAQMFVSTSQADSSQAYQGELFSQQRAQSYARLLTGEEIAKRVVEELDLPMTPAALSEEISSSVVLDTVILTVSVTDEDPQQARTLAQQVAETFVTYVAELETPEGLDVAPIKATIVDPASVPGSPVSPKPVLNLAIGFVLGLLVGLLAAVVRELVDTSIKSPEDLSRTLTTPLLGTIAFDKDAPQTPLVSDLGTHHPRAEAIRVLRTNLQFVDIDGSSSVFVISSSVPGEGKSTTATNLAISMAEAGRRVVLVEGDLRRPKISDYLGIEGAVGLTTVLVGRVGLDQALQPASSPGLDVLTSGSLPPNPSEILQTQVMSDLVADLRGRYDVVLIDAPPLLPVTDAALLASISDGVLLVIRHGRTSREQVRSAAERLESVGARLVGVVLNMTPPRGGSYGYGYGYGYGTDFELDAPKGDRRKERTPRRRSRD